MAITHATMTFAGQAPTKSGQVISFGGGSNLDFAMIGLVVLTLDGTDTTVTVNWIDGTETLPFTPTRVFCFKVGGNATEFCTSASAITNASFLATLDGAGTVSETINLAILIAR